MSEDSRATLLALLARHAYQRAEPGKPFQLASGARSHEYLDCRQALGLAAAKRALGRLVRGALVAEVQAVGGLTLGADPVANAAVHESAGTERELRAFWVRKDAKDHGRGRRIEGPVSAGDRVCVVDDVVTSGGSTIKAIEACREGGLEVIQVLAVVDREAGGLDSIQRAAGAGVPVTALFSLEAIRGAWEEAHGGL
ncbi:MAG: orotate phosphoribosyltransferase [Myxococcota bacterium]